MNAPATNTAIAERRKELDDFAQAAAPAHPIVQQSQVFGPPADRVFGAVDVAVKRDEAGILKRVKALAAAAGGEWYYRFPVRNKKSGKTDWIEGPSIKLANDVARLYGNCDIDVRMFDNGDSWVFYARFTDFETGYTLTRPFQQRKAQSAMNTDAGRAQDIAFQIGVSKAVRNVTTNALQTYADFAFEEAKNSLVEKIGKDLPKWREQTSVRLSDHVEIKRVEAVIGRVVADWLAPDIARVIAMMKAVSDGMATIDETFPPIGAGESATESATDQGGGGPEGGTESGPAAAGVEAKDGEATRDKDKPAQQSTATASTPASAPASEAAKKPDADKVPADEREYVTYCEAWIKTATSADLALAQWTKEKGLRNKSNVGGDAREDLKGKLDAKVAELKAAAAKG